MNGATAATAAPRWSGRPALALVRGSNDVASAVAVRLAQAGYAALLLESPAPAVTRRGQAFADAAFDGAAWIEDVLCRRVDDGAAWARGDAQGIALTIQALGQVLAQVVPEVLVDARMRKRATPEDQRGLAPLVIGLGPHFVAGGNCDIAVETAWGEDLGRVIEQGPASVLAGEPKPIGGYGRERYVYAPVAGTFHTELRIGDAVSAGQMVARIDDTPVAAPKTGILRGLVHDGVAVGAKAKCVEAVPHGAKVTGIGERPAQIAEGIIAAMRGRLGLLPLGRAAVTGVLCSAQAGELPLFARTLGLDLREFTAMARVCLPRGRRRRAGGQDRVPPRHPTGPPPGPLPCSTPAPLTCSVHRPSGSLRIAPPIWRKPRPFGSPGPWSRPQSGAAPSGRHWV
jgi:xanthine dehydrogenase accessory factor